MSKNNKKADALFPMQSSPLDFKVGDAVKKLTPNSVVSDVVGVVTHLLPKIHKIRVQWNYGNEQEDPEQIFRVDPKMYPPGVSRDSSYSAHDLAESEKTYGSIPKVQRWMHASVVHKVAEKFLDVTASLTTEIEQCRSSKLSSVQAYLKLSSKYSKNVSDTVLRQLVAAVYEEI